ncbi:MAG: efflux RND transporter periplasmic adaptor subunit [Gammaproteobacteria bacterium]|nr:efflux RND transporter periplasmic adaptor subunit [Gammaproteobacteria bacterium]
MTNTMTSKCLLIICACFISGVSSQDLSYNSSISNIENIRGLVKPKSRAVLSSEISGKIVEIRYGLGERFNEGDLLVRFDCERYMADLASANAKFTVESKKYENYKKLLELNATSDIDVEVSLAEMEMARAEATIRRIFANGCSINAPYNGRVTDVFVNEFETVLADQELISILNDQLLVIELIIPSTWLMDMNASEEFIFSVDETGREYAAKITQIGAIVDPVSQTVRLIGEFLDTPDDVLSGMSGTATF